MYVCMYMYMYMYIIPQHFLFPSFPGTIQNSSRLSDAPDWWTAIAPDPAACRRLKYEPAVSSPAAGLVDYQAPSSGSRPTLFPFHGGRVRGGERLMLASPFSRLCPAERPVTLYMVTSLI